MAKKIRLVNDARRPVPVDNGVEVPALGSIEVEDSILTNSDVAKRIQRGELRVEQIVVPVESDAASQGGQRKSTIRNS